jgi:hypothetical protein
MDIRRMSREDLDRLNADGKAWRERNKPAQDEPDASETADNLSAIADTENLLPIGNVPTSEGVVGPIAVPAIQMDLWEKEGNER